MLLRTRTLAFTSNVPQLNSAAHANKPIKKDKMHEKELSEGFYDVKVTQTKRNAPAFSSTRAKATALWEPEIASVTDIPPPGTYTPNMAPQSNRQLPKTFGYGKRSNFQQKDMVPGPGAHSPRDIDNRTALNLQTITESGTGSGSKMNSSFFKNMGQRKKINQSSQRMADELRS